VEAAREFGRDASVDVLSPAAWRFVQEHEQAGARVLRVHVDCTTRERSKRDLRRPEPRPPIDANPARLQQLREHLGENVRFAEGLRRHDYRPFGLRLSESREQERRQSEPGDHGVVPRGVWARLLSKPSMRARASRSRT